ncbi:conodipine-P3-like [Gigantopelta aegis]|uniref:conodipine-P3-like n=1 Tax=Gigantopelta aegis TaxID=1735272 RepID=UPI001B88E339|nr:conodipine-P3-like [Gigantopelta aegis]
MRTVHRLDSSMTRFDHFTENVGQLTRMLKEVFLVSTLVLVVLASCINADWCSSRVNGCNIPGYMPPAYKGLFTGACNHHDVCYFCGRNRNVGRSTCDYWFYYNMWRRCRWWHFGCRYAAYLYYYAARIGGSSHYNSVSPSWCSQSWVPGCMY